MKRRRKQVGFTIAECLVSIAILAIAMTGVLAALAYDAFAAGQSGNYTFAVNYSRKLMDLLQSGQIDPLVYAQPIDLAGGINPPPVDTIQNNDGTNWHNLDGSGVGNLDDILRTGGLTTDDFWGAPGTPERIRFDTEKLKYGVNYCFDRVENTSTGDINQRFKNQLVELIVTTRWRVRTGFRSVQLRSFYVTAPT